MDFEEQIRYGFFMVLFFGLAVLVSKGVDAGILAKSFELLVGVFSLTAIGIGWYAFFK